jgi:hypothetical protein
MTFTNFARGVRVALVSAIAVVLAAPVSAHAQSAFNGLWSVLIVTDKGPCDRAYRYPVRITNGRVAYAGQVDFTADGRVLPNGTVSVRVSRGSQGASGTGRLVGRTGSGTWSGFGKSSCSGTWIAERRNAR